MICTKLNKNKFKLKSFKNFSVIRSVISKVFFCFVLFLYTTLAILFSWPFVLEDPDLIMNCEMW